MIYDCIVVGGGASGVMAALSVRKHYPDAKILLLERQFQLLRKVGASGNGRCNLSNRNLSSKHYFSLGSGNKTKQKFINTAFNIFSFAETQQFFLQLGIPWRIDQEGRAYPYSEQASAVVTALSEALIKANVKILLQAEVKQIKFEQDYIEVSVIPCKTVKAKIDFEFLIHNKKFKTAKLILACGSEAAANLGGTKSACNLVGDIAEFSPSRPALVPLNMLFNQQMTDLNGERFKGKAKLFLEDKHLISSEGEFLFTKTGLSGIAGMELARFIPSDLAANDPLVVEIDFAPEYTEAELESILQQRQNNLQSQSLLRAASGIVKSKIARYLAEQAGSLDRLAKLLKACRFKISGTKGFEDAQVVAGGLKLSQVYLPSLALKSHQNIYFSGELLDIDGKTGGFNLQWAWTSGFIAGQLRNNF